MKNNPNRARILAALAAGDVVSGEEISSSLGVTILWPSFSASAAIFSAEAVDLSETIAFARLSSLALKTAVTSETTSSGDASNTARAEPNLFISLTPRDDP